jgi:BirA family transcriptional regulator, biotin operon repressor / biotin---[acetyl-CoA-carboxylase] ligase
MRSVVLPTRIFHLDQTESTQKDAKSAGFGIYWTTCQTAGVGRYSRTWFANPGESVAVSICLEAYCDHPKPYLLGMAVAVAVAEEFNLNVQWPNDLVIDGKKVAGILTEIHHGLPVIGIGLNVLTEKFPVDIAQRATSLKLAGRELETVEAVAERIFSAIRQIDPVPSEWSDLRESWDEHDATVGKLFTLHDGRVGVAQRVTEAGALLWSDGTSSEIVTVAEALWGFQSG